MEANETCSDPASVQVMVRCKCASVQDVGITFQDRPLSTLGCPWGFTRPSRLPAKLATWLDPKLVFLVLLSRTL